MSKFTSFLFGGFVGACLALAFAPQSGDKTRALVTEKANALAGEAKDFASNMPDSLQGAYKTAVDQGTSFVTSAVDQGSNLVNEAADRVKEVAGQAQAAADSDELRDKIEAARQRIASQVMQNAEADGTAQAEAKAAEPITASTVDAVQSVGAKEE